MRCIRSLVLLAVLVMVSTTLTACGGKPVTFAEVPRYPGAIPVERGSNIVPDSIAGSLEQSLAGRGRVELQIYRLPANVLWEEIDGFYTESLSDSDWKTANELRQSAAGIDTTGWTRGILSGEQGLMLGYTPDVESDGAFLIVALFSEA